MTRTSIVPASRRHAASLGPRLRVEDQEDIAFFSPIDFNGEGALFYCILKSKGKAKAAVDLEGHTQAMWGTVPSGDGSNASVWLMGSDQMVGVRKVEFLRRTFGFLQEAQDQFPLLFTYCLESNEKRVRWLQRLGFKRFKQHVAWGVPFIEFVRIKT